MKNLKKLALLLMMLVLVFSLSACGGSDEDESGRDRDRVEERDDEDEDKDKDEDEEESKDDEDESKKDEPEVTEEPVATEEPKEDMISAKELILEISEASKEKAMTSCSYVIGMNFGINMEDFSMDMNMSSKGDMVMSMEPYVSYTEMVMQMKVLGQETVELTKSYMLEEDGQVVTYTYVEDYGEWTREESGLTVEDMLQQNTMSYDWLTNKPEDEFVIDSELHTINGKETYKVSLTLTGEEMQAMMDNMGGMEGLMEETGVQGIDYTLIDVPATYYVDTTTHQVVQMDMNIEGMGELMTKVLEESFSQDPSMAGYQVEVTIGDFILSYTNISYDPVEVPEIPAEILAMQGGTEVDPGTTEVDPGTTEVTEESDVYVIEESGNSVQITCAEGWKVTENEYDTLTIESEDGMVMANYTMYVDVTAQDFVDYIETVDVVDFQTSEIYISHESGPAIGSFETMVMYSTQANVFYAWAPVEEGWIFVQMIDLNMSEMEDALTPVLDMIDMDMVL